MTIVDLFMARLLQSALLPLRIGLCVAVSFLSATTSGQEARDWRLFTSEDNLGETHTATVSLAPHGEVIFTHHDASLISLLDGYGVNTVRNWENDAAFKASRNAALASYRVLKDASGVLWTVYPQGLAELRDGLWFAHPIADIEQEFKTNILRRTRLSWVQPLGLGRVLFLLPARLMEFDSSKGTPPASRMPSFTRAASER